MAFYNRQSSSFTTQFSPIARGPRNSNLLAIPSPLIHRVYNPQNQDRGGEGLGPSLGTRIVKRGKDGGLVFAILILLLRYEVAFIKRDTK